MSEIPPGTGFTTFQNWQAFRYKGIDILYLFTVETGGEAVRLTTQCGIEGAGIVTEVLQCDPIGMSATEAGLRWLSELDEDDHERFYQQAFRMWKLMFYGGD